MTPNQVRRLFKAGANARAVLVSAGVKQADIAGNVGLPQSRISDVLAGRRVSGPAGKDMARRIYGAIASELQIDVNDMPEARRFVDGKK